MQIDHVVIGRGPAGGSWHRMDPNLRTLSLAAWMGLPGLDFNEWDARQMALDEAEAAAAGTHLYKNALNSSQALKPANGVPKETCAKCEALRKGKKSAAGGCGKCTSNGSAQKKSSKGSAVNGDVKEGNSPEKTKGSVAAVVAAENGGSVPRRNLSLKRLMSKEVETRALISRVAQYYENYVIEMGLEKYFINDAIVTCVWPIRMCFENFNGKFRKAKWFVSG